MKRKTLLCSIGTAIIFGAIYGVIEYYAIQEKAGYPFPKGAFLEKFSFYHIWMMAPIFLLVAFAPLFPFLWAEKKKWPYLLAGVANFFLAVTVEDGFWFICRVLYPLKEDSLGGQWIQKGEWTARWGSLELGFGVIPWWYFGVIVFVGFLYFISFKSIKEKAFPWKKG
ncbi:MAG: hypothetical protein D6785_04750 [Planctomycetota bacterium]|nr:MAG: hypothetical protein D6785_04750 [Planctomycetota bacterium]